MVFGRNKYKKELQLCQRILVQKSEEYKQKYTALEKQFSNYRKDMDVQLYKKEEVIRKFGDRWLALENDVLKKEEELKSKLIATDATQKEVIENLKNVNDMRGKVMDMQKEQIDKLNEKVQVQDDRLEQAKQMIERLNEGIGSKEKAMCGCLKELKKQKEQIDHLKKEISDLHETLQASELEAQKIIKTIENLQAQIENENDKIKTMDRQISSLQSENSELNKRNKNLEVKTKEEEEGLRKMQEIKRDLEARLKQIEGNKTERFHKIEANMTKAINQNELLKKVIEGKTKEIKNLNKMAKLNEQIKRDEMILRVRDATVERLNEKWQILEQTVTDFEIQCRADLKNAEERFSEKIKSRTALLETVIASEQKTISKLHQAEETIKHLENESTLKEIDLLNKEKQMDELKDKLETCMIDNSVLKFQLFQSELRTTKERANMEVNIREQIKEMNGTYQKQRSIEYDYINQYIDVVEEFTNKTIEEYEETVTSHLETLEGSIDEIMQTTGEDLEDHKRKINELKSDLESLQVKTDASEANNKDLKEELARREKIYDELKRQVVENMKLLQNEILKSEVGPDKSSLGVKADAIPSVECMLRQIHTRNVLMKELNDEMEAKDASLARTQERYARLTDKIKRVTVAVTEAKAAYEDLERENEKLREALKKKIDEESTVKRKKSRRSNSKAGTIVETYSAYDMHSMDMSVSAPSCHIRPPSRPVEALCEALKPFKTKNKTNVLKVGFIKNDSLEKTRDCKEKKKKK